jgi:MFS family permease
VFEHLERAYLALFREYPALIRFAVITGAGQTAFALLNVYALPIYLFDDLHLTGKLVGTTASTFLVFETLFKFPMGRLSDRYGRRLFVTLGPLLISLNPIFVISLPQRLWTLIYPLRAADGAGGGALWPPLFAMIGDVIRTERRSAAMAFINIVYAGGSGLGIALGVLATDVLHSHHAPFFVATALLMIAGATGWFGLPRLVPARRESLDEAMPELAMIPPLSDDAEQRMRADGLVQHSNPIVRAFGWVKAYRVLLQSMLISFLMVMAGMTLGTFIVKYVAGLDYTRLQLAILAVVTSVPAVALGLPLGHFADRWGRPRAVRVSLMASALLMWLVPVASNHVVALAAVGALLLASNIMGIPAWLALVSDLAPASHRGGVMGIVAAAEGIGAGFGPILGGILWDINHSYIFYGAAGLLTLCAVFAALVLRTGRSERL